MRNLRLIVAYEGTRYHGWQFQPGLETVEGWLRSVLAPITQTDLRLVAASRTDAGVHALGQTVNFRTASTIDLDRLRRAANSRLPADILVRRIDEAAESFHSTRDARGKLYRYTLWADSDKPPFADASYVYHFHRPLDLDRAAEAAARLVGTHDFKSFETTGGVPRLTTVRTIHSLDLRRDGPRVAIDVAGDGFLYNMVRNIVGTLLEVARGRWTPDDVSRILAACDRATAGPTAPAQGLTLVEVFYGPPVAAVNPSPLGEGGPQGPGEGFRL